MKIFIVTLMFLSFSTFTAQAQDTSKLACDNFAGTGLDEKIYQSFADSLQAALKKKDAAEVSKMIRYPIKTKISGKKTTIKNAQDFELNFSKIFNDAFLLKIEKNTVSDTVCNSQGLGWANGSLWINAADFQKNPNELKVIAINN
jgi:hypothetical protein